MAQQPGNPLGRWMALGGLGWINVVESLVADGCVPSAESKANLETVYSRLGVVLDKLDGGPAPQTGK